MAGTTGAGKSVSLNAMLTSILLGATPAEARLLLVDTKRVELQGYAGIPHLLAPVIHDAGAATRALEDLVVEMERRYTEMSDARVRNLDQLNAARVADGRAALPRVVCVIDEFADLMLHAPEEVELAVVELAQKARAIGIHLVHRDADPARSRHHRGYQGEHPGARVVRGRVWAGLARDPRLQRRGAARRSGRHAAAAHRL